MPANMPLAWQATVADEPMPHAVIAAIFLSSYLTWRPSHDIMFTLSDALFLLGFVRLAYRDGIPLEPFRFLTTIWLAGFAMLVFGLFIGSINGPAPSRWLIVSCQYLFAWVVLPMILLRRSPEQNVAMIKSLIWGVFAVTLFGALVYFTYTGTFEDAQDLFGQDFLSGGRRLGGFAGDANWNGAMLAMTVPFVIFLRAKGHVGNIGTALWLAVLLLGVMLSASFTAFVSCVAALAIFMAVGNIWPSPRSIAVAGAGGLLAIGVLVDLGLSLPATFVARVGNAIGNGDISEAGTYQGRMELMREAWGLVEHHMLVGVGADQYRVISALGAPVHNMYLLLWVEGGLISLVGWMVLLAVLLAAAVNAYPRDRLATALALSVTCNFIIASMASPHMYARLWAVPVLLAVAVSLELTVFPARARRRSASARPVAQLGRTHVGR